MQILRRAILAIALIAGLAPAFAAAPPPVPALPDTERRTSYSITASNCACAVNFALYGDSTDYQNWVEVYVNGVLASFNDPSFGWTITSPSGPLANLPRPITDAVLTFNSPQTGTVQIVGSRRPRRASQFSENAGVPARNVNQVVTDITATLREMWDKTNDMTGRGLFFAPGNSIGAMPSPSACANSYLAFSGTGLQPVCVPGAPGPITSGVGALQVGATSLFGTTVTLVANGGISLAANAGTETLTISTSTGAASTVAALRALAPGSATSVNVTGYYAAGDGGGGTYVWNSTSTLADNAGSVIQPNAGGTGRWILTGTFYTPEQFGAQHTSETVTDAAITAGQRALTSVTANFTSSMVGWYVTINGAGASGAPLVTTITSVNSSTSVTVNTAAGTTVSGATAQIAFDDAAPIRAALCAITSNNAGNCSSMTTGTGKLRLSPVTYNLYSYMSGACYTNTNTYCNVLEPYPNLTIEGSGPTSVLRLANGMIQGSTFARILYTYDSASPAYSISNTVFQNFAIDSNGNQNDCGGTCWANSYMLGGQNGTNILIDAVTFLNNPGANDIVLGGASGSSLTSMKMARITNTVHNFVATNGNISLAGYDYSSVFAAGVDISVVHNQFANGPVNTPSGAGAAIEVHGYNVAIADNQIDSYQGGIIAGNESTTAISATMTVTGNSLRFVNNGIAIAGINVSGASTDNILVANNAVFFNSYANAAPCIDASSLVSNTVSNISLVIANNSCFLPSPPASSNSNAMIAVNGYDNLGIFGNSIFNAYGPCISTGHIGAGSGTWNISNNLCTNPGLSTTLGLKNILSMNTTDTLSAGVISGNVGVGATNTAISGTLNVASNQGIVFGNTAPGASTLAALGTGWTIGATCGAGAPTATYFSTQGISGHC